MWGNDTFPWLSYKIWIMNFNSVDPLVIFYPQVLIDYTTVFFMTRSTPQHWTRKWANLLYVPTSVSSLGWSGTRSLRASLLAYNVHWKCCWVSWSSNYLWCTYVLTHPCAEALTAVHTGNCMVCLPNVYFAYSACKININFGKHTIQFPVCTAVSVSLFMHRIAH